MFGRVPEWKRDRETLEVTLRDLRKSWFLVYDNGVAFRVLARVKGGRGWETGQSEGQTTSAVQANQ